MRKSERRYAVGTQFIAVYVFATDARTALEKYFGPAAEKLQIEYRADNDTATVSPPPFLEIYEAERQ